MTTGKKLLECIQECLKYAEALENQTTKLIMALAEVEPSHNAVKAMLEKAGFADEATNEGNLKAFIDHHTRLVADNTAMTLKLEAEAELMKKIKEVVIDD